MGVSRVGPEFIGSGRVECSEAVWTGSRCRTVSTLEAVMVPGIVGVVWDRVIWIIVKRWGLLGKVYTIIRGSWGWIGFGKGSSGTAMMGRDRLVGIPSI